MSNPEIDAIRELLRARPRPVELAERRERLDAMGARYALASDVRTERVDASGVPAEWTLAPGADPNRVIIFLHGGGYISGSIESHRHMVAEAGRQAQARTLALGYRLAPEHPFYQQLKMGREALAAVGTFIRGQCSTRRGRPRSGRRKQRYKGSPPFKIAPRGDAYR